jgi:hypothetical protein
MIAPAQALRACNTILIIAHALPAPHPARQPKGDDTQGGRASCPSRAHRRVVLIHPSGPHTARQ